VHFIQMMRIDITTITIDMVVEAIQDIEAARGIVIVAEVSRMSKALNEMKVMKDGNREIQGERRMTTMPMREGVD